MAMVEYKFDHTKKNITEALGLDPERIRSLTDEVTRNVPDNAKPSEYLEVIANLDASLPEKLFLAYLVGLFICEQKKVPVVAVVSLPLPDNPCSN